jgi:hypothetical protein
MAAQDAPGRFSRTCPPLQSQLTRPLFVSKIEHVTFVRAISNDNGRHSMQNLSPRHVKTEESLRLGVVSGWYSTKVSGTFVSGPHDTEADCLSKIAELNPPPAKRK